MLVVASATGVLQRYYQSYARFMADAGYAVLTFDYRGIGASRPARLRGVPFRMQDWGIHDLTAAIDYVGRTFPATPVDYVGHSVGGQILGLSPSCVKIRRAQFVASQYGYWKLWPLAPRVRIYLHWFFLLPVLTHLFGYFPARKIGLFEDLPRGVALEWARWCKSPDFLFGCVAAEQLHYEEVRCPILSLSFSDDDYAPVQAVRRLLAHYPAARVVHRHVRPEELGLRTTGHFGYFKEANRPHFWPQSLAWFEAEEVEDEFGESPRVDTGAV